MSNSDLIHRLIAPRLMREVDSFAAQAVLALRYAIICHRGGHDPRRELVRRWGSERAAKQFQLIVEATGFAWPEPFTVAPPCCPRLSFDEALLADMTGAARRGDRAGFDALTRDMLGGDARAMLFGLLGNLYCEVAGRSAT